MTEIGHLELVSAEAEDLDAPTHNMTPDLLTMRSSAADLARSLAWVPGQRKSYVFRNRRQSLSRSLGSLLNKLATPLQKAATGEVGLLRESAFLLENELEDACATFKAATRVPQVRTPNGVVLPRIAPIADDLLVTAGYHFSGSTFTDYIQAFQDVALLEMEELWMLIPVLKLVLLEQIVERGRRLLEDRLVKDSGGSYGIDNLVRSLREIGQTSWKAVIEPLIRFDQILRQDPVGAYSRMDYESRDLYRKQLATIADHSECTETEVANEVLALARQAQKQSKDDDDPRVILRRAHVGSYLLAEGAEALHKKVGFRPPIPERLRAWLRRHPDEFYLTGIAALAIAIVSGIVFGLTAPATSLELVLLATLAVLLPSSQGAVQIMNYLATQLLPAQILPKLDFSDAIPDDCITLVAVPAMLLNEKQVRKLADDLEVRFLGNQDPNLHFALLTDLPDSAAEPRDDKTLVDLCADLVRKLADKYAGKGMGTFFLFHRHLAYNPRERLWMGWERKRGKLMDLNNLLSGEYDSFPVKVGDLSILSGIRFVITLDSDTELPRGSARRLVGALAHPLNQAIIDPLKGIVAAGYGILQPRVGVSVQSTARSRLASIYSGQTGFDIYTHATSDVYQDLYGEGIFVGKGIYEVKTLQRVLARRFPCNALLSHDLIEGAYARAGLISDVEVIEDYPSHYSAYNRRKHRWLRGDWQITEWLLPMVPEESGRRVPNPLSVVSRWKILDNLRRSLVEPASFLLFLLGWTLLPGRPWAWTLAAIAILFLPALCQLAVDLAYAAIVGQLAIISDALNAFLNAAITNALTITFLAHQALLSLDAVVRTMVRRLITRQRLLQWETAAEAELAGYKRTTLDIYLGWTPILAAGGFLLVWLTRRAAVSAALPVLLLWACSKPIALWLNRPTRAPRKEASEGDQRLLRVAALRTWRYFSEFSTEEHHWLIPDNVQEDDLKIAPRISPTNLGFLLNARQAACEFGYLSVPEFAQQTLRTLATVSQLQRYRGHLFNWYDTQSLVPLAPTFVSTVDSGNLMASLWALEQGCLQLLDLPLLHNELCDGFVDHLYVLESLRALSRRKFSVIEKALQRPDGLLYLLNIPDAVLKSLRHSAGKPKHGADARWFQEQAEERIRQAVRTVLTYAPWLLPEFAGLKHDPVLHPQGQPDNLPGLQRMPAFIDDLLARLHAALNLSDEEESKTLYRELLALLPDARSRVESLIADLTNIAGQAAQLADEMDFRFLLNPSRQLLSVGFDVDKQELHAACYDLLASEARIAFFAAIAKDDIPQECWFQLGRSHTVVRGMAGLLSWTGTMFEYLMPSLWMRTYPNTVLERSAVAAVRSQRAYAAHRRIPWGISESACFRTDDSGNYQYYPFGIPQLAIHKPDEEGPVVSPYSTFLALEIDSPVALRNLRTIRRKRALGSYGFYEALDFNPGRCRSRWRRYELVRCWMAHHQGMSLLATANFLHDDVVQRWFHGHAQVQATELLLQEKLVGHVRPRGPGARAA
jgi:cyclic beta-1,2-glucan synthetase